MDEKINKKKHERCWTLYQNVASKFKFDVKGIEIHAAVVSVAHCYTPLQLGLMLCSGSIREQSLAWLAES